ncbi:DUF6512 family protein [Mycolicibacterium baixiangningiae]|uniref:DUF6512 family protein n=1 Tax=Mycolicibacterium baixiangningiae TaxID=2761578 RepID=UPI00186614CD|nr:DUF6512 family protein [Mycolicibacterium baixiangningiae]
MASHVWPWTVAALPVVVACGVLLHFTYARSGRNRVVAVFAPVNESLWEHLKMAYWPLVAYTVFELVVAAGPPSGLLAARAAGFVVTAVSMLTLSAALTATLPRPGLRGQLLRDGMIFVVSVILGLLACEVLLGQLGLVPDRIGAALLALPAAVFAVTTFAPPHTPLFEDQITGGYGTPTDRGQRR